MTGARTRRDRRRSSAGRWRRGMTTRTARAHGRGPVRRRRDLADRQQADGGRGADEAQSLFPGEAFAQSGDAQEYGDGRVEGGQDDRDDEELFPRRRQVEDQRGGGDRARAGGEEQPAPVESLRG